MSDDGERELYEEPIYKTYAEPLRVPPPRVEGDPQAPEPPAAPSSGEPPPPEQPHPESPVAPEPPRASGEAERELYEEPVYKTYVQPIRVPAPRVEPAPHAPDPQPAPPTSGEPPPQERAREPESPPPRAPEQPPAESLVAPAPSPARKPFKDFAFRTAEQKTRGRRFRVRALVAVAVAAVLALAYPIVNPFGSSSGSSLTPYLRSFQPIAVSADQDRRNVESAVNAVRRNPKTRTASAQRLVRAQDDRQALIRRIASLGPAPGAARALPARLTQLLRIQLETGRVWLRWMQRRPFKYLKNDAATRNRTQALLKSQQASKGSFTRLYNQLVRSAGSSLTKGAGS